jgi:hypothetical protein
MSRFARLAALVLSFVIAGPAVARAADPSSELDPRLGAEREAIARTIETAARNGLPVEILHDKLREGLAKGVAPARITAALVRLSDALATARVELAGRPGASARLYRAVVDAHAAGASRADVSVALAATARTDNDAGARAVEALGDLARRGFPPSAASRTVAEIARARPDSLNQLVAEAESLRRSGIATPVEALDALARAAQRSLRLDEAGKLLPRGARDRAPGNDERGPDRETQGSRGRGRDK